MAITIPSHGGQLWRIAEGAGVAAGDLLDFSTNINPDGPPAAVVAALRNALEDEATIGAYPDLEQAQVRRSISMAASADVENVVVANGFVPLLDAALQALPIRSCLLPVPAFSEYRSALERAGVMVAPYVLQASDGFRYRMREMLAAVVDGKHDAVLLANPQNPSGVLLERDAMLAFVDEAAKLNVTVLLDEAFIDYAPADSIASEVVRHPNLVVFRSVTKFYGMPGLRVAYALTESAKADAMRRRVAPWPVTTLASVAVTAALADEKYAKDAIRKNEVRRRGLAEALASLGMSVSHAAANFLLLRFGSEHEAQTCWQALIDEHRIVLRHCGNFEGLTGNHLRCAVRNEEDNARLVDALATLRRPTA